MNMHSPNRLVHEKSPYLLQHAYNPVDWLPWGDEAFERARNERKPIFLSIGYSTCHWCHVMERESFENGEIAEILNAKFVPVKVDREERPDIDRIYMAALQGMGQGGGWPMSMFLTPELVPFYGGTYFPPTARYGRAGFPDVLERIHYLWTKEQDKVQDASARLFDYLRDLTASRQGSVPLLSSTSDLCFEQLSGTFDPVLGGFGGSPKFPRPAVFSFLLSYYHQTAKLRAREMTELTLRKMALGGMYDHVGGGFHRYSVDAEWRVPHFEKMLYDQAQLIRAYLDAFRVSRDPLFAAVARDILDYVKRDMTSPDGCFYSAEDADSARHDDPEESGEGAFYVWSKKELLETLGEDALIFCYHYGIEDDGNATVDPQHEFTGRNIVYVAHTLEDTARVFRLTAEDTQAKLAAARDRLLMIRNKRPRPLRDDKILLSWNGLMVSALAHAYQVLGDRSYLNKAEIAADALMKKLHDRERNVLLHRYRDGEARYDAHLDDYVFFVQALIDLYESTGDRQRLKDAVRLTERQIEILWDVQGGGFFETGENDQSVLVRMKESYDGAEPSGNSVAASNLVRLARSIDRPAWEDLARKTLNAFSPWLTQQPAAMPNMVASWLAVEQAPRQVVFAGDRRDPRLHAMQREVFSRFLPGLTILQTDGTGRTGDGPLVALRADELKTGQRGPATYLCEDFVCRMPATDPQELARQLEPESGARPAL